MRRLLASAVGVVAFAALVPALASADGGGIRTTVNGHAGPLVAAAALDANSLVQPAATTRAANGQETVDDHDGTTAKQLAVLAGIDPAHVTSMAIDRPNTSGAVMLTHAEIVGGFGGDPLGGRRDATFRNYDGAGGGVQFFRPMRDDLDVNRPDELDAPTGSDLVVHLTTDGPVLSVSPHADPPQVPSGTPVQLTVSPLPGATYTWDFGDGQAGAGATVDHTYAADGSYSVTVMAITHDGGSGAGVVQVQVGAPGGGGSSLTPAAVAPAASAGGGGPRGVGGGARRAGGGRGGPAAPATGPARGARTGAPSSARPASAAATTSTPPHTAAPAAQPPAQPAPRAATHRTASSPASRSLPGDRVSGIVLAGAGAAAALTPTGAASTQHAAAARASASAAQPLSWWLLAGVGLALLVGLGAARESGMRLTGRLRPS